MRTEEGIFKSNEGDIFPNYSFIYNEEIQKKWHSVRNKRMKYLVTLKGKKNPVTTNPDFINFVIKSLTKQKVITNFQLGFKGNPIPRYFKRFYGYEHISFFPSSFFIDIYLTLANCYFRTYYNMDQGKVIDQFLQKIMKKDHVNKEEKFEFIEVGKGKKYTNLKKLLKKKKIRKSDKTFIPQAINVKKKLLDINRNSKLNTKSSKDTRELSLSNVKVKKMENQISENFKLLETQKKRNKRYNSIIDR